MIPIKNIFYMLCYAWNVLDIADDITVGSESFDDAYNMLARVFSFGVGKLIRSGFHKSYIDASDELSTIKGKIIITESIKLISKQKRKLFCSYDEYSADNPFNQIIRYTINSLIKNQAIDEKTKKELIKQSMFFAGISPKAPTKEVLRKLVFNQNNTSYKLLISIAVLLHTNTTVNEENGENVFRDFYRDELMHKVFEQFLLNFYRIHLDHDVYKVHAPKIDWRVDDNAYEIWEGLFDIETNPGDRRTDIVIENKILNLQLIFDAKYYKKALVNKYMNDEESRVRASHLNQLRGYLLDSDFDGNKIGALIYPMVINDLNMMIPISGTNMAIKTINLADDWQNIEADLIDFKNKLEIGSSRSV